MGVRLRFRGGPLAGQVWEFEDDVDEIIVGRDAKKCHVVVPEEMVGVGRQHFGLKRSLGRYRLVLNRDNPVYLDGKEALDGAEVPEAADLRLGRKGPRLTVMTLLGDDAPETIRREEAGPGLRTRLEKTESSSQRNVKMLAGIGAFVVVLGVLGWQLLGAQSADMDEQGKMLAEVDKKLEGFAADADSRIAEELRRYEKELDAIKGSLGADHMEVARLVVERQERAKVLADLSRRQGLSDAGRKGLEKRLQGKLADADRRLGELNTKLSEAATRGSRAGWSAIAKKYEPGIFLIVADFTPVRLDPFTGKPRKDKAGKPMYGLTNTRIGTAFCVREDGLLATNAHVVLMIEDDATVKIHNRVAFQSGTGRGFEIVRFSRHPGWTPLPDGTTRPEPDVGFIQVKGIGGASGVQVPVLPLADEAALRKLVIGGEIGTVGYPGELGSSYVDGMVALKTKRPMQVKGSHPTFKNGYIGRLLSYDGKHRDFVRAHYIQHSAILSGGTSGSPLFNQDGVVIGIHHATRQSGGLEFGIRADEINDYWATLKKTKKSEGW